MRISDKRFPNEDMAEMAVLDHEDWHVSALQVFPDVGVPLVPLIQIGLFRYKTTS